MNATLKNYLKTLIFMINFTQTIFTNRKNPFKKFVAFCCFLMILLSSSVGFSQSYLGLDGGFEGSATIDNTTTYTVGQSGKWAKSNATQTLASETSVVRSGVNAMRINNSSTTGRRIYTPTFTTTTGQRLVIQYYRRAASTTNTQQAQSMISFNGVTNNESTVGSYTAVTAANTWEKVTYVPTGTTSATTLWGGLLNRQTGSGGDMFIDDVVIYVATAVDNTAPNSSGAITFSGQTTSTIDLSWGAASGGVDNGGYIVVRGTIDPTTAPNVNGIYATSNTLGSGTIVYSGTGTSFTDTGLSASTTYFYRIYTFDKAYNYSSATTGSSSTISSAITSAGSGNWSSTSTWSGGVIPTSADNALILNGHVVVMDSGTYATRNAGTTTTVDAGGTLATSQTYVNNGTTTINGSFRLDNGGWVSDAGGTNALVYGTNGTLIFNTSGSYGVNNGNYWPSTSGPVNVTINSGGINLGFSRTVTGTFQTAAGVTLSSSTLTLNGICQLNSGGFFNNSPTYGAASTLVYNTSYGVFNEWTGNGAAGVGIPANVRVQSGTLTLTTSNRGIPGNMTIDSTCSLVLNGASGDLYIGGNWNNSGTFTPSGRAVFFNGAANQTITNASGETFNYLINNKSAGNLILANNVTVNATAGSPLQLLNASAIDLNGQTLTLSNNGGNLQVTGGARSITSSVAGGILSITGTKTVSSTSSGTLTIGTNVTTSLTNGMDFGSSLTTIEGKLQVNGGGYVISNAPIYAATSTLEYNSVTGYGVNNEWTGNATTAGVGTPQNVTLTNSSVNLPNAARSLAGNLTIGTGSTLNLNGTLGADFNIGGNWNNSGTFNPNNRLVTFRGALAQTLTGATTFDYLKIDNSAGLTLNNSVTNTFTLDLTSGVITLGTNNLTIGSAGTVINASATSYVRTNSTGQFKRTVGASATLFPTGDSAYNPITFNNSGTSDEYGVRVLDGALTTGVNNTKTVSRSWVTTETTAGGSNLSVVAQYNSGEENTNFIAGTNPKIGFYNGSTWVETVATAAGSNPVTYSSNTNVTPSDLTSGTQYFAIGKDNAFLSLASQFVITSITPTSPGAGYPFSVTVQSQDAFNAPTNVVTNTSFTLSTNGNAGAIGGTITGTIVAGTNSIVVSGVTLASAGTGATVTATQTSGDPLTAGTSATFNVLAAASQLAFVGVPATGNVGVNLASFTVEARRPDNSVDTFYTGNIIISKASGTGNLSGTTVTEAAVAGVATFTTAQFDAASTYTLYADSGSFSQITSGSIVVTLLPTVIAQFDFTPFSLPTAAEVTTKDANVSVTDFAISSGTLSVGQTTGTVFPNEPFVAGTGGYTSTTQAGAKNFNFTINANNGYQIEVTSFEFNSLATGAGPSAISFDIASGTSTFTTNAPDTVLLPVNQTITGVANLTTIPVLIQGWLNGSRASSGAGNFRIDDVIVKGYVTCLQPTAYNVTGGGAICVGTAGTVVGLSNSQVGINYQLKVNGSNIGSPVAGTGAAISFGNQNTIGTYTVEATNTNGTCNELVAMTGSVSISAGATTTWIVTSPATTPAWDNGTPDSTMTAVISANYSEATALNACTLTVNSGAVVTIPSGTNVILNGALTVVTGSSFTLNNNANLLQSNPAAVNTGNIIVKRQSNPLIRLDYTMWSSPVTGQGLYAFSPFTFDNRFYVYNTTSNLYNNSSIGFTITGLNGAGVNGTDTSNVPFTTGKGYLIRLPYNHPTAPIVWNGSFTGVPNNGTKTITLANVSATQQFNAVGNPYPSPIDIDQFATDNASNIESTLYFWRKTNNAASPSYCTWNTASSTFGDNGEAYTTTPNGVIQTGQGFIVEAKDGATSLEFNNGQRVADNANQFFRANTTATPTNEAHRVWLNLTGTGAEYSQAVVGYFTNATSGADAYDSKYFNDGAVALNMVIGATEYVIQGRPTPFQATDVVPLNYKVTTAGNYTFAIDHVDGLFTGGAQAIYIKDNQDGSYHNLSAPYTFTSAAGTFANRFELVYQTALTTNDNNFTANSINVIKQQNDVVVRTAGTTMQEVTIYDIRGRVLVTKNNINASETKINVGTTNQVLLVQVTTVDGVKATKKVVN